MRVDSMFTAVNIFNNGAAKHGELRVITGAGSLSFYRASIDGPVTVDDTGALLIQTVDGEVTVIGADNINAIRLIKPTA